MNEFLTFTTWSGKRPVTKRFPCQNAVCICVNPPRKRKVVTTARTCVLRPLKKVSTWRRSWSVTWSRSSAVELLLLLLTSVAVSDPSIELTRRLFCCCSRKPWYESYLLVKCRTARSSAGSSGRRLSSWGHDPYWSPPGFMMSCAVTFIIVFVIHPTINSCSSEVHKFLNAFFAVLHILMTSVFIYC
jgi:hypothetical protein